MTALCVPTYMDLDIGRPLETGVSEEAREHESLERIFNRASSQSATLDEKIPLISSLINIANRCQKSGWDGYDALPLLPESVIEALKFILILPENLISPDIYPEPDGGIGFDWDLSNGDLFSVSAFDGKLIYSRLSVNGSKNYGEEKLLNEEIPESIEAILSLPSFQK